MHLLTKLLLSGMLSLLAVTSASMTSVDRISVWIGAVDFFEECREGACDELHEPREDALTEDERPRCAMFGNSLKGFSWPNLHDLFSWTWASESW